MSIPAEDLFRNAPSDATHYLPDSDQDYECWVKSGFSMRLFDQKSWRPDTAVDADISSGRAIPRPAKPWSGPEDGLPPVGTECETRYHAEGFSTWHKGICVAVGESPEGDKICVVQSGETIAIYRSGEHLRAIITQEQQRETAIRDVMDIAQVDCRVTAARLVDAGFKREGV